MGSSEAEDTDERHSPCVSEVGFHREDIDQKNDPWPKLPRLTERAVGCAANDMLRQLERREKIDAEQGRE